LIWILFSFFFFSLFQVDPNRKQAMSSCQSFKLARFFRSRFYQHCFRSVF
jgi:hypothetical protein